MEGLLSSSIETSLVFLDLQETIKRTTYKHQKNFMSSKLTYKMKDTKKPKTFILGKN